MLRPNGLLTVGEPGGLAEGALACLVTRRVLLFRHDGLSIGCVSLVELSADLSFNARGGWSWPFSWGAHRHDDRRVCEKRKRFAVSLWSFLGVCYFGAKNAGFAEPLCYRMRAV